MRSAIAVHILLGRLGGQLGLEGLDLGQHLLALGLLLLELGQLLPPVLAEQLHAVDPLEDDQCEKGDEDAQDIVRRGLQELKKPPTLGIRP